VRILRKISHFFCDCFKKCLAMFQVSGNIEIIEIFGFGASFELLLMVSFGQESCNRSMIPLLCSIS